MKPCPKFTNVQIEELNNLVKHTKDGNEVRKAQAILLLDRKTDLSTIIFLTGIKRSRVFGLRKLYLTKGIDILKSKSKNKKTILERKQLREISHTVKTKKPEEADSRYKGNKFWTTAILADYIDRTFEVKYKSKTSYYLIFKRVKFSFHKPGRVYVKQDPKEIKLWKKTNRIKIKRAWDDPNTVILCEDESIISTQVTTQKIWLEANTFPRIEVNNTRKNKSIYGFLNIKTGQEHSFATDYQTMYETAKILKKIREIYPKNQSNKKKLKLLILWDSAGWHKGSEAQKVINEDGKIKQIFFPRYTPELNPQEHVWEDSKEKVIKNRFIPDIVKTAEDFVNYLNSNVFKYKLLGFRAF
jgi:transposase